VVRDRAFPSTDAKSHIRCETDVGSTGERTCERCAGGADALLCLEPVKLTAQKVTGTEALFDMGWPAPASCPGQDSEVMAALAEWLWSAIPVGCW
jgi:hypothetical protein